MVFNNIQHIYFDLDHTLWDFDKNSALAFKAVFQKHEISISVEDFLEAYIPINLGYWKSYQEDKVSKEKLRFGRLKDSFDMLKISAGENIINAMSEDYIDFLPDNNFLLAGSKELLTYLQNKYVLHIITNGFEEVQYKKLRNAGISNFFKTVTTSEEAGVKKPNRLIFETALQKSAANPANSLMIGDNLEADVYGARDFGMHHIFFDYYGKKEKIDVMRIETLNELQSYL